MQKIDHRLNLVTYPLKKIVGKKIHIILKT
jgi:hypothetical protein